MSLCPQEEAAAKQGRSAVQRKWKGNSLISPDSISPQKSPQKFLSTNRDGADYLH